MNITRRQLQLLLVGLIAVGAIGPWAKASVFGLTVNASGTDGDGVIVLIAAAALLFGLAGGYKRLALLGAIVATGVCVYDYFHISSKHTVTVDWGLWLALLASVVSLGLLLFAGRVRQAPPAAAA